MENEQLRLTLEAIKIAENLFEEKKKPGRINWKWARNATTQSMFTTYNRYYCKGRPMSIGCTNCIGSLVVFFLNRKKELEAKPTNSDLQKPLLIPVRLNKNQEDPALIEYIRTELLPFTRAGYVAWETKIEEGEKVKFSARGKYCTEKHEVRVAIVLVGDCYGIAFLDEHWECPHDGFAMYMQHQEEGMMVGDLLRVVKKRLDGYMPEMRVLKQRFTSALLQMSHKYEFSEEFSDHRKRMEFEKWLEVTFGIDESSARLMIVKAGL